MVLATIDRHLQGKHDQKKHASSGKSQGMLEQFNNDPDVIAGRQEDRKRGDVRFDPGVWSTQTNNYTLAARVENERIADSFINPKSKVGVGEQPVALLAIGKPGAGKTTSIKQMKDLPEFTSVNADDVMPKLKGYNPRLANSYHERAGDIAEHVLLPKAIVGRHNILFDATGKNSAKMENLAKDLKSQGYKVGVLHVSVTANVAMDRAYKRFKGGGRLVSLDYINGAFKSNPDNKTYNTLKTKYADFWQQNNNNGSKARIIEAGNK